MQTKPKIRRLSALSILKKVIIAKLAIDKFGDFFCISYICTR